VFELVPVSVLEVLKVLVTVPVLVPESELVRVVVLLIVLVLVPVLELEEEVVGLEVVVAVEVSVVPELVDELVVPVVELVRLVLELVLAEEVEELVETVVVLVAVLVLVEVEVLAAGGCRANPASIHDPNEAEVEDSVAVKKVGEFTPEVAYSEYPIPDRRVPEVKPLPGVKVAPVYLSTNSDSMKEPEENVTLFKVETGQGKDAHVSEPVPVWAEEVTTPETSKNSA
jgi:hypothetical protein